METSKHNNDDHECDFFFLFLETGKERFASRASRGLAGIGCSLISRRANHARVHRHVVDVSSVSQLSLSPPEREEDASAVVFFLLFTFFFVRSFFVFGAVQTPHQDVSHATMHTRVERRRKLIVVGGDE
jgi:hypothetical protein